MREAGDGERAKHFSAAIISLDDFDIVSLSDLPSAALRAAIERVRAERNGDRGTTAYFESSLRHTQPGEATSQQHRE